VLLITVKRHLFVGVVHLKHNWSCGV